MRFLSQDMRSGSLRLEEAPVAAASTHGLLIRTSASLVSAGTERMLVDFGRASLLGKARQQPGRVREVLDKAATDGVGATVEAVRSKLAQPLSLGYANAGVVVEVGSAVRGYRVGDLVASNGPHAEVVSVPATLAAPIPESVSAEAGCFASVAAVGLQGIRLAEPSLGEWFVVTGLGLIGLLTVDLLRAAGCEVLGVDPDESRRMLAEALGATSAPPGGPAEAAAAAWTKGRGVDGVIVCASTTSSDPIREAARMCRQRGRVVLVGVTGLDLVRSELYEKEISLQVSSSYGPGRYDPGYESGIDYPVGLVRWTAGRNMEAALGAMASGRLDVAPLITHRYAFDDAAAAYQTLVDDPSALGIVLLYGSTAPATPQTTPVQVVTAPTSARRSSVEGLAVIGAGNFATRTLLPAISDAGGTVLSIVSRGGVPAALAASGTGAAASTDVDAVLADGRIGAVFVATRHDSHADLAIRALRAGKAVYVEKPLALTGEQLDEVAAAVQEIGETEGSVPVLAVGFNRRFAPVTLRMKELLAGVTVPRVVVITVNAGVVPPGHWTHDPAAGGGRILGEGCHFVDLARHLVGRPITDVTTRHLGETPSDDTATISLAFEDGSTAAIHYLANGSPRFPKERVEVFCQGRVLVNDNFKSLRAYGWPKFRNLRLRKQDKGHRGAVAAFLRATRDGGPLPIPVDELLEVSRASLRAAGR